MAGDEGSLWNEILDSVRETRSVAVKQAIVLGSPGCGKSTLVSHFDGHASASPPPMARSASHSRQQQQQQVGLAYSCFDVNDSDNDYNDQQEDDTVARVGVYQARDPAQAQAVLPLVLTPETALDSVVVVCLDWERPWLFLRALRQWIRAIKRVVDSFDHADPAATKGKQRLEASWKADNDDDDIPLGEGVLGDNLGVPVVIVCTKSDYIAAHERDLKDDHFDNIQQVIRTLALHYGAACFFTSIRRPDSFAAVRKWILHTLLSNEARSSTRAVFTSFDEKPNVVDRDQLVVPAGWDTWGKIRLARESFDPSTLIQAWSSTEIAANDDETKKNEAVRMYEAAVPDTDAPRRIAKSSAEARRRTTELITVQPEQDFLKAQFDLLLKEREKDPRSAFAAKPDAAAQEKAGSMNLSSAVPPPVTTASVLGPMSSASSLRMPNVEKAFANSARPSADLTTADTTSTATAMSARTASTAPASSAAGGGQNEVLANFFQSLLEKRSAIPSPSKP